MSRDFNVSFIICNGKGMKIFGIKKPKNKYQNLFKNNISAKASAEILKNHEYTKKEF